MADDVSPFQQQTGRLLLWLGPLIGPLAWITDLQVSYSLNRPACEQGSSLLLHSATLVALLIAAVGVWLTWRNWKRAGESWPGEEEGIIPRSRFLAFVGFGVNVLFVLAIVTQAIPKFMLSPCQ